jgi:hypothetical protein
VAGGLVSDLIGHGIGAVAEAGDGLGQRREFEYVRHGTVSIVAAMNVATGGVIAQRIRRNDSVTFIGFSSCSASASRRACGSA